MHTAPLLLPTPRRIELLDGPAIDLGTTLADAKLLFPTLTRAGAALGRLRITIDGAACGTDSIGAQSYTLELTQASCTLHSPSVTGARHGLATLRQLLAQYGPHIPQLRIIDSPRIPTRGLMLDVSRDRVPTMRHLFDTVDQMALLKLNHLQLYTEHTFAYEGHEDAWRGWSPITHDEIRRLDDYARARGVELVANQNCFGHLRSWLELPRYAHLAETHGDWMFDVWPRSGPFSLCPTDPASLRFVEGLLDQLLPCFHSKLVNIGCDETYDIAHGRSKDDVARRGRAAVYMDFVNAIAKAVRDRGGTPMFWADIALSHPEAIANIPEDMIALAWGYEPDAPFADWCASLREHGRRAWVCPGTSSWRSITGRTTESVANITNAAACADSAPIDGFLLCDWGDTGHWQQWPITHLAMARGAAASWNSWNESTDLPRASFVAFGDPTGKVAKWLAALGDLDLPLRETCGALSRPDLTRLRNQSALFIDLFKRWDEQRDVGPRDAWATMPDRCAHARADFARLPVHGLLRDELEHTLDLTAFACSRGAARRTGNNQHAESHHLRERIAALITNHQRLWRIRSREGGLAHSCTFWSKIIEATEAGL